MKKLLIILLSIISINAFAQSKLKYSGFFDSYYTSGPVKYFVEPGLTYMGGDLGKSVLSGGIGAGVNYRVLPAIYLNGSLRYLSLNAKDHVPQREMVFKGSAFQLALIGNYHFVYDMIRKSYHRRRGAKKANMYVTFGLAFNLISSAKTQFLGTSTFNTTIVDQKTNITQIMTKRAQVLQFPIGFGIPIRVTPRFTFTPEIVAHFTSVIPFIQKGTDNLDGISYKGGKKQLNDTYTFINFKFMFNPKGKRLHPKQPIASNSGSSGGGSGGLPDDSDDFEMNNFDDNNSDTDETIEQKPIDETDEVIEEEIEETEEIIEDEFSDDENETDEETETEEDQYDEDGFLIDE